MIGIHIRRKSPLGRHISYMKQAHVTMLGRALQYDLFLADVGLNHKCSYWVCICMLSVAQSRLT